MKRKLSQIDQLIKEGATHKAQNNIRRLVEKRFSRQERVELATLAKRSFMPLIGISLLKRVVRSEKKTVSSPTPRELIEYANCLVMINVLPEAMQIFTDIDKNQYPEVLRGMAFLLFKRWEYLEAIPYLEKYIEDPNISSYDILIGQTNLVQAYVHEKQFSKANKVFETLIPKLINQKKSLLLNAVYEFKAEQAIYTKQWNDFEVFMNKSINALSKLNTVDLLYYNKMNLIYELHRSIAPQYLSERVKQLQKNAAKLKNYETIRDLDYHWAVVTKNQTIAQKLWIGTPHESYKERILKECPWFKPPTYYDHVIGSSIDENNGEQIPFLDLSTGKNSFGNGILKKGHIPQRLLLALASDLYKTQSIYTIFTAVFSDKYFNPVTSPDNIYQAIKRVRIFLKKNNLPLFIKEQNGFYSLQSTKKIIIRIPAHKILQAHTDVRILNFTKECKNIWEDLPFTAQDVAKHFKVSKNSAINWIRVAIKNNLLIKKGKGVSTNYQINHKIA